MLPFFVVVCLSSNPTIVTLNLPGWYMLGVFLLLAIIWLAHERHYLLSLSDECMMHTCAD